MPPQNFSLPPNKFTQIPKFWDGEKKYFISFDVISKSRRKWWLSELKTFFRGPPARRHCLPKFSLAPQKIPFWLRTGLAVILPFVLNNIEIAKKTILIVYICVLNYSLSCFFFQAEAIALFSIFS